MSALECWAAGKADNDVGNDEHEDSQEDQQACVLPPEPGLQPARLPLEGKGLILQVVCLVHEKLYSLPSVQYLRAKRTDANAQHCT